MDEFQRRSEAANQLRFREMNERIKQRLDEFLGVVGQTYLLMCECSLDSCELMVEISSEEYAHIRSVSTQFFVLPNHVQPLIERVLERTSRFWIIKRRHSAELPAFDG